MKRTLTEALTELQGLMVRASAILGCLRPEVKSVEELVAHAECMGRVDVDLRFERGWGTGCSLRATVRSSENYRTQPEDATFNIEVDISWSACGHNIPSALAALTLYQEITNFGATIETMWNTYSVTPNPAQA